MASSSASYENTIRDLRLWRINTEASLRDLCVNLKRGRLGTFGATVAARVVMRSAVAATGLACIVIKSVRRREGVAT